MTEIKKPFYGEPCNQCGWCCELSPCRVATKVFPHWSRYPRCKALTQEGDGRKTCAVLNNPGKYFNETRADPKAIRDALGVILAVGRYCDAKQPSAWVPLNDTHTVTDNEVVYENEELTRKVIAIIPLQEQTMRESNSIASRKALQLLQHVAII